MPKIIISRTSQRINRMREYDIYMDEEKISSINDSEKKYLKFHKVITKSI
ncbi:hypothetical protein [Clostridium weizhouense]|uniref:Uncharacterized protein n=1 Tax=Clostridium weizhouense TaxID=2859781 RepID=A0ABS7AQ09_9CLOT|nr:hypothetical protein [Clostridium weizhouense]MBW6410754.1 hypothetical protein [Clostridium weizhouense]